MRIAFAASELTPLAKTGGLGDVATGLGSFLAEHGEDLRLFLPFYSRIQELGLAIFPVDFLQGVPLQMGGQRFAFSVFTARHPDADLQVYLIHCPELYDRAGIYESHGDEHLRFTVFSRAVIECCQRMGWSPDIFHANDWHTALIPLYLKTTYGWDRLFADTRTVLTIHNIGYQGVFSSQVLAEIGLDTATELLPREDLNAGIVNFLKAGLVHADLITTVSKTYAQEIQTEELAPGLSSLLHHRRNRLVGIVNGVDYREWNPATDELIPHHYSPSSLSGKLRNKQDLLARVGLSWEPGVPTLGIVSRLTSQKGFELMFRPLPDLLAKRELRLVVLGTGELEYEDFFQKLQGFFPRKVCYYRGYSNELAHLIEAGSDIFLMPSRYEPCGLNQMYSLKYGTVPVVRKTGGLADTVEPYDWVNRTGTGFVFEHFTSRGFRWAVESALETFHHREIWRELMLEGMSRDFSWERQGLEYLKVYRALTGQS